MDKESIMTELIIARKELGLREEEKVRLISELRMVNKELAFLKGQQEKRAAELSIANIELAFQNDEKEKRSAELRSANKKLVFQNNEKEKRAAELSIANDELVFQNEEKEKRAEELIVANKELAFQNEEKEKRATELSIANKELVAFTYISSHDLQEPLRKIQTFIGITLTTENHLSDSTTYNLQRVQSAARRMQQLIEDLLAFSRINTTERTFERVNINSIIDEIKIELKDTINEKQATIEAIEECCFIDMIGFQFRQLMYNLLSNALKFSRSDIPPSITIKSRILKADKISHGTLDLTKPIHLSKTEQSQLQGYTLSPDRNYCHITVSDNGVGFEPHFSERIFEVFQKLHNKDEYAGTGIGLAIVKKIVENHQGIITATSELNKGATFDIYIPTDN
ncbi:MAG TPA: ATP-binding protein [Chryseolinea sp.]|nr:ATP-binding protein [Chryseolinea sp.]